MSLIVVETLLQAEDFVFQKMFSIESKEKKSIALHW